MTALGMSFEPVQSLSQSGGIGMIRVMVARQPELRDPPLPQLAVLAPLCPPFLVQHSLDRWLLECRASQVVLSVVFQISPAV